MADATPTTIAELIREKQRELAEAESLVLRLRRELQEARFVLLGSAESPPARYRETSSTDMAEEVLRRADRPLHVNQILAEIEARYQVQVKYATLVGNISRLIQKGKVFERTGPNTFGLLEWAARREEERLFGQETSEDDREDL